MTASHARPAAREPAPSAWYWLAPLCYMLVVAVYFLSRYGGRWAEADSSTFTNVIRPVAASGSLVPSQGAIYPNGYAYQAISSFILALTGLEVSALQQLVYPLVTPLLVLPAWLLYRELTGSARGAMLSTLLLFTQPEFLFVILRSSHEKFTRTLLLLCLYFLVRSFKLRNQLWPLVTHICLYYLALFGLIAHNNLLANSFVFAVAVALLLGWLLSKWQLALRAQAPYYLQRMSYGVFASIMLVYIFTFYVYPPAEHDLLVVKELGQSIRSLFFGVETTPTNAYAQVGSAWLAPAVQTYFVVSIANWLLLSTSLIVWCLQGLRWLRRRNEPPPLGLWLTWLLYAAFAAQGGLSIIADASGALSSNLQHRLFPSFSTVAVALVGGALADWRPRRLATPLRRGLALLVFAVAILSIFKATNEPLLSNKWTFYQSAELSAVRWTEERLVNAEIWTEFDERLFVATLMKFDSSQQHNSIQFGGQLEANWRYILITDLTRLRAVRLQQTLPLVPDTQQIYDNGYAQLHYLRPRTPYQ